MAEQSLHEPRKSTDFFILCECGRVGGRRHGIARGCPGMSDERLRFIPGDSPGTIRVIRNNPVKTSDTPPIGFDRHPGDEYQTDSSSSLVNSFPKQREHRGVKEASIRSYEKNVRPIAKRLSTLPENLSPNMSFAATLKELRLRAGRSRYWLAQDTGLSEPYLLRLESGERSNPSRDVVLMLGLALLKGSEDMDIWDVDVLLLSAGYAPLRRRGDTATASA